MAPINNAGIHVSRISCFWYLPKPPRNGRTHWSIRVSSPGVVVSGDTKPFSGCWPSVSICIATISLSPTDESLCLAGAAALPPVDSIMRPPSAGGESPAQSVTGMEIRRTSLLPESTSLSRPPLENRVWPNAGSPKRRSRGVGSKNDAARNGKLFPQHSCRPRFSGCQQSSEKCFL